MKIDNEAQAVLSEMGRRKNYGFFELIENTRLGAAALQRRLKRLVEAELVTRSGVGLNRVKYSRV